MVGSWPEWGTKCSFFIAIHGRFETTAILSSQVKPWRSSVTVFVVLLYFPLTHGKLHYKSTPLFMSKSSYSDYIMLKPCNRVKRKNQAIILLLLLIKQIPCAKYWSKLFINIHIYFSHYNPMGLVLLFLPVYTWGNEGTEKSSKGSEEKGQHLNSNRLVQEFVLSTTTQKEERVPAPADLPVCRRYTS